MEKIKILLVDDEQEFVETLSERIRMREHDSDVALNGEQALKKMDDDLPDVVVLDLKMPGMDGMEVLRRIRKAYPKVQVIMLMKKVKKAYKSKFESSMMAATFAEAGEFETAKEIRDSDEDEDQIKKDKKKSK